MAGRGQGVAHRSRLVGVEAFSLASDHVYPRHAHDQFGIGVITFGGHRSWSGVGAVEAGPGDVIMVNPGELHDGAPMRGDPRGWRMLYFDPGFLAREVARPVASDPPLARRFARLFDAVIDPTADPLALDQGIEGLFGLLRRRHVTRPDAPSGTPPSVKRALARIEEAPELPVSLAQLADLAGVSRFQLLRGFRRAVGVTPYAYLLQLRVRLAKRLLAAGLTPADCAAQAGFADQSHLTRAFQRQFGVTPGRYRAALI